jgi:hypothetical protein
MTQEAQTPEAVTCAITGKTVPSTEAVNFTTEAGPRSVSLEALVALASTDAIYPLATAKRNAEIARQQGHQQAIKNVYDAIKTEVEANPDMTAREMLDKMFQVNEAQAPVAESVEAKVVEGELVN